MKKLLLGLIAFFALQSAVTAQCTSRPVINSFSPNTGFIGSQVTIVGANFDATTITNNQVYFGSTQASVVSASFGTLVVTVPVGASTAPISVKNQCNLTAYSSTAFNGIFCPTPVTSTTYQNVAFDLTGVYGAYNMLSQDMDLDGKPEVISVGTGGITIARNNSVPGALSFTAYNYAGGGQQGVAADMDGDGYKDMVCTYNVYRNTSSGPGTFGLASGISTNAVSNYQIAAGDFNNDGKIDVVGCNGTTMFVALNTSTGPGNISFGSRIAVGNVGASCTGIQVADVDGDGLTDILASQGGANRAVSLRNTTTQGSSTVTFESPEYWNSGGTYPYRCQIADFDKDGKIDLTTCNYSGATNTAIFRNTSTVGDISFATPLNLAAPGGNYRIGVGDVDGDGYPDIVTKSLAVNIFSVYPNTSSPGSLSFAARIDYSSSHQAEVSGIVIGDLDGDYVPDIATSGTSSGRIKFHRNTSSQTDNTPPTAACKNIILALNPSGTASITAASIDNISISQTTFTCADIGANNVTLVVTDNAGNQDSCVAIVTVAPAAIIVSGQTTVCDGQTVPLTANLGDSYQWKKDGAAISGATAQNYTATTSGNYTVEVTNAGGCSGESAPTSITVNSNPTVAVSPSPNAYLCPNNVTLTASTSSIYQWKKNGVDISGANVQTYNATSTGSYQVQVIDLFGCSALSDVITVSNSVAEISVTGNGNNITDGSTTASAANGSDYGTVYPSVNNDQTFTISNSGSGNMVISGITTTGTDASLWTISGITLPATIATGSTATFVASFNGPTIGSYSATINIASDDCDETNFDFAVAAEITCVVPSFSTCPSTQAVSTSGSCGQVATYLAEASGVPAVSISYAFSGATTGNGAGTGSGSNFNIGTTNVTLTATNSCGTSTCQFDVVVSDNEAPVLLTQNATVTLTLAGLANISVDSVLASATDNCAIVSASVDQLNFTCDDEGVNTVTVTVLDAAGNATTGTATVTVLPTPSPVAVSDTFDLITCESITITDAQLLANDYDPLNQTLKIDNVTASSGTLVDNGNGTYTYTPASNTNGQFTLTYTMKRNDGTTVFSENGHFYEFVSASGITWTSAKAAAELMTYQGLQGYLATITSAAENQFAYSKLQGQGWIGASDAAVEGDWKWVTGPEAGTSFWSGLSSGGSVGGAYNAWGGGEPNNAGNEDYAHFRTDGLWNDYPNSVGGNIQGYVVEYGGNTGDCQVPVVSGTAIINLIDITAPNALAQNVTVQLDANGNASTTAAEVDNGSNDACGIANISLDITDFTCANVGTNQVVLSVTDINGNTSTAAATVTVEDNIAPTALAQDITVQLDATGNASITVADINNASFDNCGIDTMYLDIYNFDCSDISSGGGVNNFSTASFSGSVTLTVVDANGNANTTIANVTVVDNVAPTVLTQGATVYLDSNGSGSITVNDVNNGTNDACGVDSLWLSQTSFDCSNLGSVVVTLSATDVNGNTSSAPATITVVDTLVPVVICPSNISVNTDSNICGAIVNFAVPVGFDNCSAVTTSLTDGLDPGSLFPVGTTTVTYTTGASGVLFYDEFDNNNNGWDLGPEWGIGATAANNCGSGCTGGSDPALDHSSSSNNGVAGVNPGGCASTTVHGFYYLTSPIINTNISGDIFFEYWRHLHSDYPPYAVNTVEVFNGTSWIVLWQMPPVSSFQCINDLDWTYQNFDVTAYKNAGFRVRFGFNITSSGVYTMPSWSVDDFKVYGTQTESSTCSFDVTVTDAEAPYVITQAITVQLDSSGNASIETAQIDNGSNDACGIDTMYLSNYAFDCANVGANTVTLTVVDINGNTSTEDAIVTVEDNIAPVVTFTPANQSMNNLTGSCFQNAMFSIPTFTDACGVTSVDQSNDNGVFIYPIGGGNYVGSFPVGVTTVTYTATDANNNLTSTSFTVTVIDNEAPYLYGCPGQITVFNATGSCGANVTWADPTPSDNCPNYMMTSTHNSGDYFPVGNTVVTYTLMDPAGNTVACSFLVTVADIEAPVAACQNVTTYLDATGNASITASQVENGSTDNCGIGSLSLDNYSFTCANVGANTVTLTVTDVNGNSATCTSTVTVIDTIAPAAIAQNVDVYLDATGNGSTTAALVNNGSNDACGIASMSLDNTSFTCANVGANTVTLTVTDNNGNVSSTQAMVTVIDNVAPSVATQSVTVYLDASGNGSITAQDADNGSSDACGVASLSLDNASFTCANVGANTVILTVTDINGNSASAPATVTVIDTVAPVVLTQAVFVALDSNGSASITASQVDNGSNDACGVASMSLDNMSFTCADLGNNTVTLTVTDVNGNSASNTAPVTVVDLIAPTAIAQNITVQLDAAGNASITAQDIDNGSTDNCSVSSISIDNSSFTCANVNQANTVTLTVTDQSGNSSTATATVTVEDNVAPTAVAQNITVQLDATGNGSITAQDVDNGSNDACGVASISIDNNSFTCSDVNQANTVTLTVTDNNGNVSSTTAVVTVEDNVGAVVVTQNASIVLDASGVGSITVNDVENGSTDACGIASISVDQANFDCSHVGANTVTVTVTDVNGNVSTGTATVTVSEGNFVAISSQSDISESCASTSLGGTYVSWSTPTAGSFTSCNAGCPSNTSINGYSYVGEYNGHRYYKSQWPADWSTANAAAQAIGGHLVSIGSQGENDFIEDIDYNSYLWIGLSDANAEGTFEWSNGEAVSYTNWEWNEPNNNGGNYCGPNGADYVAMHGHDGEWHDRTGNANYRYIVEIACSNPITITQVSGGSNGSLFSAGVDTIVYQATDNVTGATASMSFTVSVDACPEITYCNVSGNNSSYEWIDRVRITGNGGFNNQSGNDGGYGDYTNIIGEVEAGEDFDLKLYPGFSGSSYSQYWRVYIDWNGDGDFTDNGELEYQSCGSSMRSAEIDVPNNAPSGEVRMRVMMKWGGYPSSCGSFSYGEVEDYTLVVEGNNNGGGNHGGGYCYNNYGSDKTDGGSASEDAVSQATYELARLYPNPYANGADLKLEIRSMVTEQMELDVVNSMGQIVETLSVQAVEGINTISLDVKPLAAGVYFVRSSNMEGRGIEFIVQ